VCPSGEEFAVAYYADEHGELAVYLISVNGEVVALYNKDSGKLHAKLLNGRWIVGDLGDERFGNNICEFFQRRQGRPKAL
jgi:hypothetical protein